MASKAERTLVTGTSNVHCINKIRALRIVTAYREKYAQDPLDMFMEHHTRMLRATAKIQARKRFIDESCPES